MQTFESWGRFPKAIQTVECLFDRQQARSVCRSKRETLLAYGNGRSYGDSCLNDGGTLLYTRGLDRFIEFDPQSGLLRCEAGVTFDEILKIIVPHGWFLPVTPGTRFVTIGGAIANDVHGKNHHRAGTIGCHVSRFELCRSEGTLICSNDHNREMFCATIGGLGLTGLIIWVELRLKRVPNAYVDVETQRFCRLEDFFLLSRDADSQFEYTVAWIDCLAQGSTLGRGIFSRANHSASLARMPVRRRDKGLSIPVDMPFSLINRYSLRAFNFQYYWRAGAATKRKQDRYPSFFYPLDGIQRWNRLYGRRGFLQYQCVVPPNHADAIREILSVIAKSGQGSFLAVLKMFGAKESPGLLSFPRCGPTLALDFPHGGEKTLRLLEDLDSIVRQARGAVYPAKDARMSAKSFLIYYPQLSIFEKFLDPAFSSSFWRRVNPK